MITSLRLQQFRSYRDAFFEFGPGVTIIVGSNGSGKTNLLEAILVTARGSSFRVADQDLIAFDTDWARLDAETDSGRRTIKLQPANTTAKTFEIDEKIFRRLTLQHSLPVVLFEPNHLRLLHGSPESRRTYLDELLSQTTPGHATLLRNYRRVLAQRNALLKRARKTTNEELFPWNLRLGELGALLARRRAELLTQLDLDVEATYRSISQRTTAIKLEYLAQFPLDQYESRLLHKLETDLPLDLLRGFTAAGPHREDFSAQFDGRPASETASRGETRTLVLALKILELELIRTVRNTAPLLLLDDVFSELDASRRQALTAHLADVQTFITTTDADAIQDQQLIADLIELPQK